MSLIQSIFYGDPDLYPPIINGSRLLAADGLRVSIISRGPRHWRVAYPSGVQVKYLHPKGRTSYSQYWNFVVRAMRGGQTASAFVGHDMHGFMVAKILACRHRKPLIYHCHDFLEQGRAIPLGSRVVSAFERRWARTSDIVIVPDVERAQVVQRELCLEQAALVVANAPLMREASSGRALREALAERGKRFEKIVFRQGRVGPSHVLEETLDSLPLWNHENCGFVVMGMGEPDYIQALQDRAQRLGVRERFVVLPPVSYDVVAGFTPGADVGHALYHPIHINNMHISTASNKIMEYMAAGVPLVTSERPGLKELMVKHGCGLTADESSPKGIAQAINALLGNDETARRMGAAGRRAFEDVFCYERQFAPALQKIKALSARSVS